MTVTTADPLLYRPNEAAELLQISRSRMFELIAQGEIESVKLGHLRRVPAEALTAYVAKLRAAAARA